MATGDVDSEPRESFRGGIRESWWWGGTYPAGHLEFDEADLRIWSDSMNLAVTRDEVLGVELSLGILATRVTVVLLDGTKARPYFAALGRGAVREALHRRGWRVVEHRRGRSGT